MCVVMGWWRDGDDRAGTSQRAFLIIISLVSLLHRTDGWRVDWKSGKPLFEYLFFLFVYLYFLLFFFILFLFEFPYLNLSLYEFTVFHAIFGVRTKIKQFSLFFFTVFFSYFPPRPPPIPHSMFLSCLPEGVSEPVPTWRSQFVSLLMWWLPVQCSLIFFSSSVAVSSTSHYNFPERRDLSMIVPALFYCWRARIFFCFSQFSLYTPPSSSLSPPFVSLPLSLLFSIRANYFPFSAEH